MIESTTVTTLRSKAEEIEHRIKGYEREIEIAKNNLVAVKRTLAIFEADPTAPYHVNKAISLRNLFKRHELPTLMFEALAKNPDGLDTRELAAICLRHRGLDSEDVVLRRSMAMKVINTLDKLRLKGRIVKAGFRSGVVLWKLPQAT
jgi:hypothetical protein